MQNSKNPSIKSIAENFSYRIWDKKDLSVIDELVEKNIVIHSLLGDYYGSESMKKIMQTWWVGFPDVAVKNSDVICEKDLVVIHWTATGTHKGEFKDKKPTGKQVAYAGTSIYRIKDSKIAEYWAYLDMNRLLNQIS